MRKTFFYMLSLLSVVSYAENMVGGGTNTLEKGFKSKEYSLFNKHKNYRIPSLLTTSTGKIIAAADLGYDKHLDWDNVDVVVKVSEDGGLNFGDEKVILDLVESPTNKEQKSAFYIDPSMLSNDKEVLMLIDMFPKSKGFGTALPGTGYEKINGEDYRKLNKFNDQTQYYISKNGEVFTKENSELKKVEGLNVILEGKKQPFKELGDIYKDGERIGNVFRGKTGENEVDKEDYDGEYLIHRTAYLYLTKSSDDGKTWNTPVDITSQVKEERMNFLGTGPGVGIKLKNGKHKGRLLFPIYFDFDVNGDRRTQQSALIYSDDNGNSWKRGESIMNGRVVYLPSNGKKLVLSEETPKLGGFQLTESQVVELNDGTLKLFMRSMQGKIGVGTSKDGGQSWDENVEFMIEAPYCQVSAIHYGNIGDEEFLLVSSGSESKSRTNGKINLVRVNKDGSLEVVASRLYKEGPFAYSSLAKLPNGDVGILYEPSTDNFGKPYPIDYTMVSLDWITNGKYEFKDMLPYQKSDSRKIFNQNIFNRFNTISKLNKIEDLNNLSLEVSGLKDKKMNDLSLDVNARVYKDFGIYAGVNLLNLKELNFNISGLYKYESKYIDVFQALGLEAFVFPNKNEYISRGNVLSVEDNFYALRSQTRLKTRVINETVNKLTDLNIYITPKLDFDLSYIPYIQETSIEKDHNNSYKMKGHSMVNADIDLGTMFKYKKNFLEVSLTPSVRYNGKLGVFEKEFKHESNLSYKLDSKLGFTMSDKFKLDLGLMYEGSFLKKDQNNIMANLKMKYEF